MKKDNMFNLDYEEFKNKSEIAKLIENVPDENRQAVDNYLKMIFESLAPVVNGIEEISNDPEKVAELVKKLGIK